MSILLTLVILGVMIFVHELGHFASARIFGVHVEEFSLGMGPALIKKQKGETLYSVRAFPLGGFCRMEGENGESASPRAFSVAAPWKRLIILASGAAMNLLLALLLFITVCFFQGDTVISTKIDRFVSEDAPAAVFAEGDEIVKIDRTRIHIFSDISLKMMENHGEAIDVTVRRGDEEITKTLTPYKDADGYKLGFYAAGIENTPALSVKNGFYEMIFSVKSVFWAIRELVTGNLGLSGMAGPIGVASVVGEAVDESKAITDAGLRFRALLLYVLNVMALLGANLGVMNLLPFPALDGGRIVFALIELLTKKKVPDTVEAALHAAGFVLLMGLALVVAVSDVTKLLR